MNQVTGERLRRESLLEIAADLGSDCPFFIDSVPAIMSGRGELLEALPEGEVDSLRGQRIILFRPNFSINTAWAYRRLIEARPSAYELNEVAAERLDQYRSSGSVEGLLFNTFEASVGVKYLAIPCLLDELRAAGYACLMSGSGSCCFALAMNGGEATQIRDICQKAWGSGIFFIETSVS